MSDAERTTIAQYARFSVEQTALARRDGSMVDAQYVRPANAVVILPLLDAEHVVLIRNHRFAVGQELWELPAGTIETGEDPLPCAARELEEEAGYRSDNVTALTEFVSCPGICTERMFAFLARDLEPSQQKLDPTERITPEVVAWNETMTMVRDGVIADAKTLATLLYAQAFIKRDP
ncbi:MAG: NUDIX hydrolase [Phycisphaeraceae bacterium]